MQILPALDIVRRWQCDAVVESISMAGLPGLPSTSVLLNAEAGLLSAAWDDFQGQSAWLFFDTTGPAFFHGMSLENTRGDAWCLELERRARKVCSSDRWGEVQRMPREATGSMGLLFSLHAADLHSSWIDLSSMDETMNAVLEMDWPLPVSNNEEFVSWLAERHEIGQQAMILEILEKQSASAVVQLANECGCEVVDIKNLLISIGFDSEVLRR
ncbi:MAG: hypothetical protein AAF356_10670 [Planctomycetota bacterium]